MESWFTSNKRNRGSVADPGTERHTHRLGALREDVMAALEGQQEGGPPQL